jgi:Rieske 2Fe-2S family protein
MSMERTLERASYLSSDVFAEEKERIFCRQWSCVGREEEVPQPGDYLLLEVAGECILLVRTREGELTAHYNVCRHRGSQLVLGVDPKPRREQELVVSGRFTAGIKCPYHAWTYNLDGSLRTAPFLDEGTGFRKDQLSLHPVGVETWGGFVFVNLGGSAARRLEGSPDGPEALATQLGAAPERLKRYPLAELRIGRRITYQVAANWKVILENYNECYHCVPVHPELCRVVPAFKQKGGMQLDWDRGVPHREGAWTFTMSGTTNRRPFAGLNEDELVRHKGELIYPNFMCSLSADHVAAFTLWPHAAGETTVVCDFLFHPDEMSSPDFDPMDAVGFWDITNRQDWVICESVQRGMSSRVFTRGYYAPMESLSQDIRRYIAERFGE